MGKPLFIGDGDGGGDDELPPEDGDAPDHAGEQGKSVFATLLTQHFTRFAGGRLQFTATQHFMEQVNDRMREMDVPPPDLLTEKKVAQLLAGDIRPTKEFVYATSQLFLNARIDFFGDAKELYNTVGMEEAAKLQMDRAEATKGHDRLRMITNPRGDIALPSFTEMLEESYDADEDFNQFLFKRVLPAWHLSKEQFCAHVNTLNADRDCARNSLTEAAMRNWENETYKPNWESMDVLRSAFAITPKEGELMAPQEKMLWRISHGHSFVAHDEDGEEIYGKEALDKAIADAKTGGHGPLLAAVQAAAGVPDIRIHQLLHNERMPRWTGKETVGDVDKAIQLVGLLSEGFSGLSHETEPQKLGVLSAISGRQFDLKVALEEARKAPNSGGDLFIKLTGMKGIVPTGLPVLAAAFDKAKLEHISNRKIEKMRCRTTLEESDRITEPYAKVIMDLVEPRIAKLAEQGICKPLTPELKAECIDVLTRTRHPKVLLRMCRKGEEEMTIGKMLRETIRRRGMIQERDEGSFAEQIGVWGLSHLITGQAHMDHDNSEKLAKWYKKHYQFDKSEQRTLRALAQGVDFSQTPDRLMQEVLDERMARHTALGRMYDQTGLTREQLATASGVTEHVICRSLEADSGGRLPCDDEAAERIAKEIGISAPRAKTFVQTFSGHHVSRGDAMAANERAAAAVKPAPPRPAS